MVVNINKNNKTHSGGGGRRTETGGQQTGETNQKSMQNIRLEKEDQEPQKVKKKNRSEEKN